jgi:hypothetical protein
LFGLRNLALRPSRWLGYADLMTTMRYLRVVDRELPAASSLPF